MQSYYWDRFTHDLFRRCSGCELLPDDIRFLHKLLPRNKRMRDQMLMRYTQEWHAGMDAEEIDHKKQNAGRFRANTWIRNERRQN